ncbi:GAF domain-containing protein [Plastorhodobacter daqingensis]|uniref:GAF domain-containing protein n=1 Tax=Plastorhodobacter daqingensis TaxID=1387281 RepID=A0ABW2UJY1_9RHOB
MTTQEPDAVFAALHRAAEQSCGARLFTVTVLDPVAGLARRAYTSHPAEYPTSGTKPMRNDAWTDRVIGEGKSFVANSTPEFAIFFGDHALINSLGCEAAMNIPVADDTGRVVGTVNVLDAAGHFTPDRVTRLEALVAEFRATLLAAIAKVPLA